MNVDQAALLTDRYFSWLRLLWLLIVSMSYSHNQFGQQAVQVQRILEPQLSDRSGFADNMSFSTQFAAIGAPNDSRLIIGRGAVGSGAVYIYERDDGYWTPHSKLKASDAWPKDYFGNEVSLHGNHLLVGATGKDSNGESSGSVYAFEFDGQDWVEKSQLTASDGEADDFLGHSISVYGSYAIVSAIGKDDHGEFSGAAYIFYYHNNQWVEQAKLTASDAQGGDHFSNSVSITEKYAFVGATHEDELGYRSGAVYVFEREGVRWNEIQKLTNTEGVYGTMFGSSIGVDGNFAAIGAVGGRNNGTNSGAVYTFELINGRWESQQKLLASDRKRQDHFGGHVHLDGKYIIVGSAGDDDWGEDSGSAYIFEYDGTAWSEKYKLTPLEGNPHDNFGESVYITDRYAMVNSKHVYKDGQRYWGAIYNFDLTGTMSGNECDYLTEIIDIGPADTIICSEKLIELKVNNSMATFQWSTGSKASSIEVSKTGSYWVEVSQGDCLVRDTIRVNFADVDLGEDLLFCDFTEHTLFVDSIYDEARWSTGHIGWQIQVLSPGQYWVEVTTENCTLRDSILIEEFTPPDLGEDKTFCGLFRYSLQVAATSSEIEWSTGQASPEIHLNHPGEYWVRVQQGECVAVDSIKITSAPPLTIGRDIDTLLCEGEQLDWTSKLDVYPHYWDDGSHDTNRVFQQAGTYEVTVKNECHTTHQTITIRTEKCSCDVFVPTIFTPNSDGKNDLFRPVLNLKIKNPRLCIYNRWGRKIYKSDGLVAWNGSINGREAASGHYYWTLDYECDANDQSQYKMLKGELTLIR